MKTVKTLKFLLKFVVIVAFGSAAIAGSLALVGPAAQPLTKAFTPIEQLELAIKAPAARSLVYDRNGKVMATFASEDRSPVPLKDIPLILQNAVISIEDRKFYEHHGVDWAGTARAVQERRRRRHLPGWVHDHPAVREEHLQCDRKRDLTTKAREAGSRSSSRSRSRRARSSTTT